MKTTSLLLPLLFAVLFGSCQSSPPKAGLELLDANAFEQKMNTLNDEQMIDVRTPEEFASGHLPGAININIYDSDFSQRIAQLDKSRPVLVYCRAGGRSADASKEIAALGYTVTELKGGTLAWTNAGKAFASSNTTSEASGLTLEKYKDLVSSKPLVLVDFNAEWCKPCKMLAPILDEIVKKQEGRLTLHKIDADANPELMQAKMINSIPYLELYKDGRLVWTHVGMTDEATISAQLK